MRPEVVSLKELWLGAIPTCTLNEEIGTRRPNAPFLNHFFLLLLRPFKSQGHVSHLSNHFFVSVT